MTDAAIGRLFPAPAQDALSDDDLQALYDRPIRSPWVRVNFVSKIGRAHV